MPYFSTSQKPSILFPTQASYRPYLKLVLLALCMPGLLITYLIALSVSSSTVILHRSAKYCLHGVPQGSILGPLLFSIYIDQLCSIPLSSSSRLQLYADDTLLYKPIDRHNVSDVADLQIDIDSIAAWVKLLGLCLNAQKTKFLLISRLRQPPLV